MLAVESFIQINNVNSIVVKQSQLIMAVHTCCGVAPAECRMKHSIYDMNISLNVAVSPAVKKISIHVISTYATILSTHVLRIVA